MTFDVSKLISTSREVKKIPIPIDYDIIRLFSESLYRSPHKAIEELVSNGYDAQAQHVHVLLQEWSKDKMPISAPLWVIDDGHGMDTEGFHKLLHIAKSSKTTPTSSTRASIGQFGIGKLAAYVLARKFIYLSCVNKKLQLAVVDFDEVIKRKTASTSPALVSLYSINQASARKLLAEIESRYIDAWNIMFKGKTLEPNWTAVALFDFKDLYKKLSIGRLKWVLRTGLPLHTDFEISVNGDTLASSKENIKEIDAQSFEETFPEIGLIKGTAHIYEKPLTTGKSTEHGRSHGFFIRVQNRVINLDDELFGVPQLNHTVWSRFILKVDADGLQKYLLSSREGVRDFDELPEFQTYLHNIFNKFRSIYNQWEQKNRIRSDIDTLLSSTPNFRVVEPLVRSVERAVKTQSEFFYIAKTHGINDQNISKWLANYKEKISNQLFDKTTYTENGRYAPALHYDPKARSLILNSDHPFIDKLNSGNKHRGSAKLFASSEVLLESQLQDQGIPQSTIADLLADRDQILRLLAGDAPLTPSEVLHQLKIANQDPTALEVAVGMAFQALGFEYTKKGDNKAGADGIIYAHLGHHNTSAKSYKLVYDTKQTGQTTTSADKIDLASLELERVKEGADYGFFIAEKYAAETSDEGKLNQKMQLEKFPHLTLLKIEHLKHLVHLHYRYGIPLTKLRDLFETARTVPEVTKWIDSAATDLKKHEIPIAVLLDCLEKKKNDALSTPNIRAIREIYKSLAKFSPEELITRLRVAENIVGNNWLSVEKNSGDVKMHSTSKEIVKQLDRNIENLEILEPDNFYDAS